MTDRDVLPPLGEGERLELLAPNCRVIVGDVHTFNTDTILLASFSMPKKGEVCADFGSGCGVIPLLWCLRGDPARIYAVEIQPDACSMARRSASMNGLEDRVRIVREDIRNLGPSGPLGQNLDRIACNPPYKPCGTGIQNREDGRRVARHEVTCSFSDIAGTAARLLRWGGFFDCCMRPERLCEAMGVLCACGLEPKKLRLVQQRKQKTPFLFLLEARRGGRPGLTVEPTLLVEAENGGFSEEMLRIYGDYKEARKCREN